MGKVNQIHDVRELIRDLGRSNTILLSTHILQEVEAVADHVLFVHNGRMVFEGTPQELKDEGSLEKPFYRLTHQDSATASGETTEASHHA